MFVCLCFVWFVVYSVLGWVWESTYCTIVERKWQNRGFLYGPACPIYGTGVVVMILIWHHMLGQGTTLTWWQVFLVAFFGSMVLEYATHWALEKLFHAYWWDYSNMPLNLNGRICLPASTLFGLAGLLVVYVLYEPTMRISGGANPLAVEACALLLMATLAADTAITASSLASIAHTAASINKGINDHMDQFVIDVQERGAQVAESLNERRQQAEDTIESAAMAASEQRRALAEERDRFAAALRQSRLGEMNALARSAGRRAMGAVSPDRLPKGPNSEQLAQLWRDMLERD